MTRRGTTNKYVFKKKPFFHTTSGVGEKVVFGMSGHGTLSDPFIVERREKYIDSTNYKKRR